MRCDEIVVVGAGVSGLTTAICLAEAGRDVVCWTAEPPQATTSRVAGAMWAATRAGPGDKVVGWAERSLIEFRALAERPETGVRMATGTLASRRFADPPPPEMFPGVPITPRRDMPGGYLGAFETTVPLIDMPRYLGYLERRLQNAGVRIELRRVGRLDEVAEEAELFVNCTGLGARELVPDLSLQSVRGQHVVVENPGLEEFFLEDPFADEWTMWFPHGDRVILGGIAQPGDTNPEPDPAISAAIRERCASLEPRLRDARVLDEQVGLRPVRDSVRLEEESLAGARCIHNYGHGGSGVALSWGCAREVEALVTR